MPILDVELTGETPADSAGLARRIADAAGDVFGTPPSRTWVKLRSLHAYAENGAGPPAGVQPVFVSVLLARPPEGEERAAQVEALTRALAEACARPVENVHVLYAPAAAGRVAFGGRLLE